MDDYVEGLVFERQSEAFSGSESPDARRCRSGSMAADGTVR